MRVAVRKLEGVESVKVSLNDGLAEIRLAPGSRVTLAQIREVIRSNGFTPKDARVVIIGAVVEREGAPALALDGATPAYRLADHAQSSGAVAGLPTAAQGRRVEIRGRVPEGRLLPAGELPLLEVQSYRTLASPP